MADQALEEAIQSFPIASWLQKHTRIYGVDGKVIYADCPICHGKKKLGVYRYNRVSVCGRCKDGGHGAGSWRGVAGLPKMIKLLEGCEWRQVFQLIYELAGLPEPEWRGDTSDCVEPIPDGAIPLGNCRDDERGVRLLRSRHVGHLLDSAHLCVSGHYRERVLLPCYYQDTYLGFEAKGTYPTQEPKSIYSSGMATDQAVYTLRSWKEGAKEAAVTESVIDCETFHGFQNAVGCFGGFKHGQLQALIELGIERLYWFVDGDAVGKLNAHLSHTGSFFENMLVPMGVKDDPNSLGPEGIRRLWDQARSCVDALDFMEISMDWGWE
jgi:hypothetical protein